MALNPFLAILEKKPIRDIVAEQDVLAFEQSATVAEFLNGISQERLLAAPVLGENNNVIGFVDVLDVATYLHRNGEMKINDEVHLDQVMDLSKFNSYVPCLDINPISFVLEIFAQGSHRAMVLREEQRVVLSQSDVVRLLSNSIITNDSTKLFSELTLEELGLGFKPVKTVSINATVSDAIAIIAEFGVSALAVVDHEGVLVGNFSASDLRGDFNELIPQFNETIGNFLRSNSEKSLTVDSVEPSRKLKHVLSYLATRRRHRVWVANKEGKPVGVVSLTDICRLVSTFKFDRFSQYVFSVPFKLFVTIHRGKELLKGDFFSSDPYVLVDIPNGNTYRTATIKKSLNPVWDKELFSFIVDEKQEEEGIVFQVWDEDKGKNDDTLGSCSMSIKWILNGFGTGQYVPSITAWYPLKNEKDQGQIEVTFTVQEQ